MTVSSSVNRIQFAGDASTLTFSTTPIKFFTSADLDVLDVDADGVATTLALTTDYSVTGGSGAIGTVSITAYGTIPVTNTLVIVRRLDIIQSADFVNNDASDAEVVEDAFDKLTMMTQQNANDIERSLVFDDGFTGTFSATIPSEVLTSPGSSFIVNAAGNAFELGPTASEISTAATQAAAASVQATAAAASAAAAAVQASAATTAATAASASATAAAAAVGTVKVTTGAATASVLSLALVGDSALGLTVNYTAATGTLATIASTTAWITGRTEDTAPDMNADYVNTYDASAGAIKKVLLGRVKQSGTTGAVATTSGVTVTVTTAIPSWAKDIDILFDGVSLNGSSSILVQIGSAASFETTGYVSESCALQGAPSVLSSTAGYCVIDGTAANLVSGIMNLRLTGNANQWVEGHLGRNATTTAIAGGGTKTLAGTLDRLRLISVNGTDTFDAGSVTVNWR